MSTQIYDDHIERQILSILLNDVNLISECHLEPKYFLNPINRKCYTIMRNFYQEHHTLDFYSLSKMSNDENAFMNFIIELTTEYVSSSNFYFFLEQQEKIYKQSLLNDVAKKILDKKIDFDESMEQIKKIGKEFIDSGDKQLLQPDEIYDLITTSSKQINFKRFSQFQQKIGLRQNTLNVIAARPSVGKTGFALNFMHDLADHYKCIYFNMEMTEKEIYERLISIDSLIPISRFSKLDENEKIKIHTSTKIISQKNIQIYSGSKTVNSIFSIVARNQRNEHCIVFIDHIGYVTTGKSGQSDTERIGECVRQLQLMTKDLNITVFVLCHINRSGKDSPTIDDLKDSGELEQSAHVVMILHNQSNDMTEMNPTINVLIGKNRSGKRGKVDFEFNKGNQKFTMIQYVKR